jgi:hypothetical protein
MRFPWSYGSELSLTISRKPRPMFYSYWRHDRLMSAHIAILQIGSLRAVRVRPTTWQAKRLGLPIV